MNWLESSSQLKNDILGYARKFSKEDASMLSESESVSYYWDKLGKSTLDDLLSHLNLTLGRKISLNEIAGAYFDGNEDNLREIREGRHTVAQIVIHTDREKIQISRLEKILGKSIFKMSEVEIENNALFMFALSKQEYERIAGEKGIKLDIGWDGPFEYHIDSTFLFGALKKLFNMDCSPEAVLKKLESANFGFGTLHDMFLSEMKQHYKWRTENNDGGLRKLWETFNEFKGRYEELVSQYKKIDKQLKARHKISPPQLMYNQTLELGIQPLAISFNPSNELVVMGQEKGKEPLYLQIYDIGTGKKLSSVKTGLEPLFHGIQFVGATSFAGTLSVGSNGIVYACSCGKVETFDSNLKNIEDAVINKHQTLPIQRNRKLQKPVNNIYMIVEENGTYYLSLVNEFSPYRGMQSAIAIIGKESVGVSQAYSPTALIEDGNWNIRHIAGNSDAQPRIAVRNGVIYFKTNSNLVKVESPESASSHNAVTGIIDERELEPGCIPSTHCIDSYGRIWVATRIPEERLTSIKAYSPDGKFLTHFYSIKPHHHFAFTSIAISPNDILAYSDTIDNAVRFYELPKMQRKLLKE